MTEQSVRILLVEDEKSVAETVLDLLNALGHDVSLAANGEEAIALLDDGKAFDVLISDVVMPGISGVDLAREARRRSPGIAVVLTSGFSASSLEAARQDLSDCVFLHKPYSLSDLSRSITDGLVSCGAGSTP